MKHVFLFYAVLLATAFCGCSTVAVDPHVSFPQVSQMVTDRVNRQIAWTPGVEVVSPAPEMIHTLLQDGLSEQEAIQITLLNNHDLQAVYSRLGIAQANLVQASLLHNPVLNTGTGFPIAGGVVDLSFGVAMDFIDLLYTPLRKRVAMAKFEETKLRVTAEVLDMAWRTQIAFYQHQANEQMREMRRQVAAATTASFDLAQRMREAGNLRELDVTAERALAEEAKLNLRLTEISVRESREALNVLMGVEGSDSQTWTVLLTRLPEPLPTLGNEEQLEARAIERSLDVAAAEHLIVAAAENVGLDRTSALFPELIVGGKGERDGAEWEPGPLFTIPLPFFDRGQARIARAEAELRQARELRSALTVRIRAVARRTHDRVSGHRDRALHYRDIQLPVWDRVVHEAQLQYNAMQIGPLDVLRAKEQQIETAVRYIDALRDYWLAQADLALILAGRLPPTEPTPTGPALEQVPRLPFSTLQ